MKEEKVTKEILKKLQAFGWEILCYDFPQSGTGRLLHPNDRGSNEPSINPDIIAVKDNVCLFFENKERYYYKDFQKQNNLIVNNQYTKDIAKILGPYKIDYIYYGIGLWKTSYGVAAKENQQMVDFIVSVDDSCRVCLEYCSMKMNYVRVFK